MTCPDELGISPEVLARLERTYRTVAPIIEQAQPMIAMMERVAPTMSLVQSAASILERPRAAMDYIQQPDEGALRLQPASRQELAAIVHWFQAMPVTSEPPVSERDAELAILELTPDAPEDIKQVELTVREIGQNPQFKRALQLLAHRSLRAAGKVTPWAALVLAARWLADRAASPVTQNLSPAQTTAVSNQFVVRSRHHRCIGHTDDHGERRKVRVTNRQARAGSGGQQQLRPDDAANPGSGRRPTESAPRQPENAVRREAHCALSLPIIIRLP